MHDELQSVKVVLNVPLSVLVLRNAMIKLMNIILYVSITVNEYHYVGNYINDYNCGTE